MFLSGQDSIPFKPAVQRKASRWGRLVLLGALALALALGTLGTLAMQHADEAEAGSFRADQLKVQPWVQLQIGWLVPILHQTSQS